MELKDALLIMLTFAVVIAALIWMARVFLLKRARTAGHDAIRPYLRAVPSTDEQKLDALDLALKGVVISLLGVLFTPLLIVGLVPLFYGLRKITMTLMGLGLIDSTSS